MPDLLQIVNPATGRVIAPVPVDTPTQLSDKFVRAGMAQKRWSVTPLASRQEILRRFAHLLEGACAELAATLSAETGKPLAQARGEIGATLGRVAWLIDQAGRVWAEEMVHQSAQAGLQERITYEPLGVVGNISAWNYPYFVGTNVFVPALLAGNAVLYKPSECASLTGLAITNLLHRAGVPDDVFLCATGGGDVGAALLDLPLAAVFFTGSHATGVKVAQKAAARLMKVQLELGGKDPVYVCDDVDPAVAAAATCDGAFYNAGQSCCAVERIYVHEKSYPAFLAAFLQEVDKLVPGDPAATGTTLGPLTRAAAKKTLTEQIDDARKKGAKVLRGGQPLPGPGQFFAPTVLTDVDHTMRVMQDETFGPLIGIMAVPNDDAALALMNDTPFGLTAGIFCADAARATRLMQQVDSGTVYINCCDRVSARLPWTGRHHSGMGVTLSRAGMLAMVQPKAWHQKAWPLRG